ncbi:MAG: hypothetical protein AB1479_06000 [Pseudomonadota bacterium]
MMKPWIPMLLVCGLTACGGGSSSGSGGGSAPETSPPANSTPPSGKVNASNFQDVAAQAYSSAESLGNLQEASSDSSGIAAQARPARPMMQASAALSLTCSGGGSMVMDIVDINGDQVASKAGEGYRIDYAACKSFGSLWQNGGITTTLGQDVNLTGGYPYTFRQTTQFRQYAIDDLTDSLPAKTTDGALQHITTVSSAAGFSWALTGDALTLTSASDTRTLKSVNYTGSAQGNNYTWSANYILGSATYGDLTVETNPVFAGISPASPTSGRMTIKEASGSITTIEAGPNGYAMVSFDQNGDGVAENSKQVPWSQLEI